MKCPLLVSDTADPSSYFFFQNAQKRRKDKKDREGKGVAVRPRPPRCRDSVNSLYLPACGFPAPGDPSQTVPQAEASSSKRAHGVGFGQKLDRLNKPSCANFLLRRR